MTTDTQTKEQSSEQTKNQLNHSDLQIDSSTLQKVQVFSDSILQNMSVLANNLSVNDTSYIQNRSYVEYHGKSNESVNLDTGVIRINKQYDPPVDQIALNLSTLPSFKKTEQTPSKTDDAKNEVKSDLNLYQLERELYKLSVPDYENCALFNEKLPFKVDFSHKDEPDRINRYGALLIDEKEFQEEKEKRKKTRAISKEKDVLLQQKIVQHNIKINVAPTQNTKQWKYQGGYHFTSEQQEEDLMLSKSMIKKSVKQLETDPNNKNVIQKDGKIVQHSNQELNFPQQSGLKK